MMDTKPTQVGEVTESGYINTYMTICCFTKVFDLYTHDRADGALCPLFLDGPDIHTSLLDTCGACHIVRLILPANLSAILQL